MEASKGKFKNCSVTEQYVPRWNTCSESEQIVLWDFLNVAPWAYNYFELIESLGDGSK